MALLRKEDLHQAIYLLLFAFLITPTEAHSYFPLRLYEQFFPEWRSEINELLAENGKCRRSLDVYRKEKGAYGVGYALYSCILENFPEYRKAQQAAATVILGLTPPFLQMLGPTVVDSALLASRYPFLAVLIAFACPGVRSLEAGQYADEVRGLREGWTASAFKSIGWRIVFYFIAMLALLTNLMATYQLSVWAINAFAPSISFLPFVWTLSTILVHIVGWFTLSREVRVSKGEWPDKLQIRGKKPKFGKSTSFGGLAVFIYVGNTLHCLWGTLCLSSIVLVSVKDAMGLVGMYLACTLVCRTTIAVAFASMRKEGITVLLEGQSDAGGNGVNSADKPLIGAAEDGFPLSYLPVQGSRT